MNRIRSVVLPAAAVAGTGLLFAGAAAHVLSRAIRRRPSRYLADQVVLITGGSRGLGLALAEAFGRQGARLVLAARSEEDLKQARSLLVRRHAVRTESDVLTVAADLRRSEDAERLIVEATSHFGRVDILVNNAGIITVGPIEHQAMRDFHDAMDTNFFSGVHCTLSVLPQMLRRRGGTIVNITSIGGKVAVPHLLAYTASKFASVGFSEGLHAELRAKGVHVLTVCPGLMRTGSHLAAQFSGDAEREYRWFSLAANLPGVSTSAAHAAERIVRAVLRRETEIAITLQAVVLARTAHLAPSLTARAMSLVNRVLPTGVSGMSDSVRGAEVPRRELLPAKLIGGAAAHRYNQTRKG